MAATTYALYTLNFGTSLANAWPQVGNVSSNLDLIQIIGEGGSILANVDYTGAVHVPAVSATSQGTRIGQFYSTLSSSATTAQLFANAFENLAQQDIIQNVQQGGNVSYYLSYLGVATGS